MLLLPHLKLESGRRGQSTRTTASRTAAFAGHTLRPSDASPVHRPCGQGPPGMSVPGSVNLHRRKDSVHVIELRVLRCDYPTSSSFSNVISGVLP